MCFGLPSRAWCPDQFDLALDRGIYNRNACAQLRRVPKGSIGSPFLSYTKSLRV
jgi:hypothetical protein